MESSTALEFVPGANFGVIQIIYIIIYLYVHINVHLWEHSAYQLAYKNTYNLHDNAATLALEWRLFFVEIARKT